MRTDTEMSFGTFERENWGKVIDMFQGRIPESFSKWEGLNFNYSRLDPKLKTPKVNCYSSIFHWLSSASSEKYSYCPTSSKKIPFFNLGCWIYEAGFT